MVEIMSTTNLFEGLKLSSDHTVATTVSSTSTATCNSSNTDCNRNGNVVSVVDENKESIHGDNDHHDECDDNNDDDTEHINCDENVDDAEENQEQENVLVPPQQYQVSDSYLPDKESYWESYPPIHLHCWVEGQNAIRNEMSILRTALESIQSYLKHSATATSTTASTDRDDANASSVDTDSQLDVAAATTTAGSDDDVNDDMEDGSPRGSCIINDAEDIEHDEEKKHSNETNSWIVQYLEDVWSIHESHVHDYLFNEEYILIPYFSTRFRWPTKLEYTRLEIEFILDRIGRQIHNLQNRINSNDAVVCGGRDMSATMIDDIVEDYKIYETTLLNPYLLEEQDTVMPLMRSYFTPNEVRAAMKVIASRSQKTMLGSMIHNLEFGSVVSGSGSDGIKEQTSSSSSSSRCEEFMKREGITPYCLAWYLYLEPIYIKYQIVFLDKVKALQEIGRPKNGDGHRSDDGETVPTTAKVPTKTTNEPTLFQSTSLYLMEKFVIPSIV